MDIATSKSRMWQLALVGVATAFAWIVLSLLLGLGSGQARADDSTDGKGLLGAVTSLVDETASTVTSTVTAVTGEVTGVVNAVVEVAPAPVQQPVREVVQSVGTVVTTVTEPVTQVVSGGVVGTVTAPVVAVVEDVPVVGGIVSDIGLGDAIEDVAGTVDETVGGVVDAVDDTGSSIGQPSTGANPAVPPVLPELPSLPGTTSPDSAAPAGQDARPAAGPAPAIAPTPAFSPGAASALLFQGAYEPVGSASSAPVVVSSSMASSDARGPLSPAGDLCPPTASSSGPGGTGLGAWALVALGPLAAHRAWVRRAGPEDEHAPPAPAGSTDVSPD
ncbi:hypothetical protein [Microbacterium sp. CFBP9034]|uniref:hypothetical protein n=1 Tax=Microbacterium sp. CFBP9034 TaxID=3096540 RepID=UPI002A6B3BD2|nr:hypothetical protein [Microbacterium sp. CFBP9034]MDY0908127.1 hypothetical protein [Microbacterium sp. CFBP9034]